MRAAFARPHLNDTVAVRGAALLSRFDAQNDRRVGHPCRESGEEFCLDTQAVAATRVLLIESLKARLLRATQPLNVTLRERIRAQQLTLLAFPRFAVPEIYVRERVAISGSLSCCQPPFCNT
jgi:hypothetical protein